MDIIMDSYNSKTYIDENNVSFEYWPTKSGVKIISVKAPKNVSTLNIPESIDGEKVTMLCPKFANSEKHIKEIVIPKMLEVLGESVFEDMKQLKSVILAEGIKDIGECCFRKCEGLENIQFPSTLNNIHKNAFEGCTSLKSVTLPQKVKNIYQFAFGSCENLKHVDIGGTEKILNNAFQFCENMETFICSENLKCLYHGVFQGCSSLHSISFSECVGLDVKSGAFMKSSIKEITLPNKGDLFNVSMASNGFWTYDGVEKYIIENPKTNCFTEDGIVYKRMNDNTLTMMRYPPSKRDISYISPANVERFGKYCFADNKFLSNVELSNVKAVGALAFFKCCNLEKLKISLNGCAIIPEGFAEGCQSLKKFKVPSGCTHIYFDAFSRCEKLKTVTIPESVIKISDFAFVRNNNVPITFIVTPDSYAEKHCRNIHDAIVKYDDTTALEDFLSELSESSDTVVK